MIPLSSVPLASAKDNTQKCRITLSANAVRILETMALNEINTINKHSPAIMGVLKELYLAASKTSSKLEIGEGVAYTIATQSNKTSIESQLGLDSTELYSAGSASAIKTESQLLMEMSEEDRNKELMAYQEKLMQEMRNDGLID